jgi:hypothetical protein
MKLGLGEYESKRKPLSIERARDVFLDTIRSLETTKAVLRDLKNKVLPSFLAAYPTSPRIIYRGARFSLTYGSRDMASRVLPSNEIRLMRDLIMWANDYHLNDEWLIETAYDTLLIEASLLQPRPQDEIIDWAYRGGGWVYALTSQTENNLSHEFWDSSDKTVIGFQHYEPTTWYRSEYEKRIKEHFEARLQSYLNNIDSLAETQGLVRSPLRHSKEHFEWLVLYQVGKVKREDIAKMYKVTKDAVNKAVPEIAKLIGLTLRYSGRGRRQTKAK